MNYSEQMCEANKYEFGNEEDITEREKLDSYILDIIAFRSIPIVADSGMEEVVKLIRTTILENKYNLYILCKIKYGTQNVHEKTENIEHKETLKIVLKYAQEMKTACIQNLLIKSNMNRGLL